MPQEFRGFSDRHFLLFRRIETGEVICVEVPVTARLYPSLHSDHCDVCMNYIPLRYINPLFSGSWRIGLQFFKSCPLKKGLI
jgi:hypothetical protein